MSPNTLAIRARTIGISVSLLAVALLLIFRFTDYDGQTLKTILYATLVVGLGTFLIGMLSFALSAIGKSKSIHRQDAAVAASALIRSMVAICISDDDLDDREIKMIAKIYKQLMNSEITEEDIRYDAEDMKKRETNIREELSRINDTLYDDLKAKILKASLYIIAADGSVDAREEKILEEIREGLGYSKGKLERAKTKFLEERGLQSN